MTTEFLPSLLSNVWSVFLVVFFFGGSILVHELGHFWAARRRGVFVERFSIGFGPKIFSWKGKDGVEYRVSWLPIGGYVALPQLADMSLLEGDSYADLSKAPPPSYLTKVIVFAAGAFMNVLFAFLLACVIWIVGQPQSSEMATTRIGYVAPTLELTDGSKVPSPAFTAGLQAGDVVKAIDGVRINEWYELMHTLMTSSGRTEDGQPKAVFTIERAGKEQTLTLYPKLTGADKDRRVGIAPGYELIVHAVTPGSLADKAGFKAGDTLLEINGTAILQIVTYQEIVERAAKDGFDVTVLREGKTLSLRMPAQAEAKAGHGFTFTTGFHTIHPSPFAQIWEHTSMTFRTLGSLINPKSDIGLSKVSGPVGIMRIFHNAAEAGMIPILMFTILVNVSLAVFNLLPIPVLDGGHILFATIAKLRGKALPTNLIVSVQSVFMVLLLSMIAYVSIFDVRRLYRDVQAEKTQVAAPQQGAEAAPAK